MFFRAQNHHLVVSSRKKGIDIAHSTLYSNLHYGTNARKMQALFYSFYAIFWRVAFFVTTAFSKTGQLKVIYSHQFTNSRFFHNISPCFNTAKPAQKNFAAGRDPPQNLLSQRNSCPERAGFSPFSLLSITLCIRVSYTSRRAGCRPPEIARRGLRIPADDRTPRRSRARAGISPETRAPQGVSR